MAVVEIAFSDLDTWLQAQPENTVETPYELKITGELFSNSNMNPLGDILRANPTKFVDLSATEFYPQGNNLWGFYDCTSLVGTPSFYFLSSCNIANGTFSGCSNLRIVNPLPSCGQLENTFKNCISLVDVTNFVKKNGISIGGRTYFTVPSLCASVFEGCTSLSVVPPILISRMLDTFKGCTSLTSIDIAVANSSSSLGISGAFSGCTELVDFKISFTNNFDFSNFGLSTAFFSCSNLKNFYCDNTKELKEELIDMKERNAKSIPNQIDYYNFYYFDYPNTLEIDIANLNSTLISLLNNTTSTPYPIIVTGLTYSNLSDLGTALKDNPTKFVDISETILPSITDLTSTFENCNTLIVSPNLPRSVTVLNSTYKGCSNLKEIKVVPNTVTDLTSTFKDCSSLEEIEVFEVPTSVLKTSAADCFSGCTSLTKVGIPAVENPEASDWHIALLEFGATTVKGKFYDRQGNSVTIPETTITKNKLKLPVLTDELMFNTQTSFADLESLIEDVLQYNYGYYNKFVVTPKNKQFVLYANDPVNGFTTNLPFGGGGGASDSCPLGTIVPYYGDTAPSSSWLICDGRDTTGTSEELAIFYPLLYAFLGTNKLPDFQECTLVGAGKNGTYIFDSTEKNPSTGLFGNQSHDVYAVGEFKDDQFQGHSHTYVRPADTENKLNPSSGSRVPRSVYNANTTTIVTDGTDGTPRVGETTHGKQIGVNFIIKATSGASESESASIVRHIDSLIDKISYETLPIGSLISQLNNSFTPYGFLLADGRDTTGTSEELSIHYPLLYSYLGNSNVLPKLYTLDDGHELEKEYFAGIWRDGKALYRITFEIQTTSWNYNNWKTIKDANWVTAHSINCLIDGWLSEQNNSSTYVKGCSTPLIELNTSGQLCSYNSFTTVNNPVVYCTILYTKTTDNWTLANFKYIKAVSGLEDNSTEAVEVANAISASTASLQAQYDAFVQEVMNAEWRKEYVLYESANTITTLPANTMFTDSLLNYEQVRFYLRRSTSASSDFIPVKTLDHSQLVALVDTTIATGSYNLLFEGYSSEYKQLKVSPDGTTVTAIQGAMSLYKVVGVGKITNS